MFILEKNIIPLPQEINNKNERVAIAEIGEGNFFIENLSSDMLACEGREWILNDVFKRICAKEKEGGYKITITVAPENEKFSEIVSDEAYYIETTVDGATLCGKTEKGAFYAAITFTKMCYIEGDTLWLALADILDWPNFRYRAQKMESRYGSDFMTREDWYKAIDYYADMKINDIAVHLYNCWSSQYDGEKVEYFYINSKKHPKLKTLKNKKYYSVKTGTWHYEHQVLPKMVEEDHLGDIMAYAKRRNIELAPSMATFGHNTLIPRIYPEVAPIMENGERGTQGFCASNPKTYEILFDLMDEVIDNYCKPNGIETFRLGFDEVIEEDVCHCEKCKERGQLNIFFDHIVKIGCHLRDKGIKRMPVSHDMLFKYSEEFASLKQRFIDEDLFDKIVISWWTYEFEERLFWGRKDDVTNEFRSMICPMTGYYHWIIPSENNDNIRSCARMGKELQFEGIQAYGAFDTCFDKNFLTLAETGWNHNTIEDAADFDERYAYRYYPENVARAVTAFDSLRDIMRDDRRRTYRSRFLDLCNYYIFSYIAKDREYPQNFPGRAYRKIAEDEAQYLPYLEFVREKASGALEFFENNGNPSEMNKIWMLTAMQYKYESEEFLNIYRAYKNYNAGLCDAYAVLSVLDEVLIKRDRLMMLAEETRIEATAYTYIRNMSILRQAVLDLRNYFRREISAGRTPKFDVLDWNYATGKTCDFLR